VQRWRQVIDGVCKDTTSRNSAGISLAPEPSGACPAPIRPLMDRHRQELGHRRFHAQAVTEAAIVMVFPPQYCRSDRRQIIPAYLLGCATLVVQQAPSAIVMKLTSRNQLHSILFMSPCLSAFDPQGIRPCAPSLSGPSTPWFQSFRFYRLMA